MVIRTAHHLWYQPQDRLEQKTLFGVEMLQLDSISIVKEMQTELEKTMKDLAKFTFKSLDAV